MCAQLTDLGLDQIVARCREEARQDRTQEVGYCFELFRRALELRDDLAWQWIEAQYGHLVLKWLHGVAAAEGWPPQEVEELQVEAFARLWRTLTQRPLHLASRFEHVGALLRYLNQCAVSTALDRRRQYQRGARLASRLQSHYLVHSHEPGPEQTAVERLHREEQLAEVRSWVQSEVADPQEQLVLFLSFEQDMPPAQIAAQYGAHFADVQEVRRVKERVLKRAKRALAPL